MSRIPRKPKRTPEREALEFNQHVKVGDTIEFCSAPGQPWLPYKTRTPASSLSGHTAVVWVEGKSGCVAISHCRMTDKVAEESQPWLEQKPRDLFS